MRLHSMRVILGLGVVISLILGVGARTRTIHSDREDASGAGVTRSDSGTIDVQLRFAPRCLRPTRSGRPDSGTIVAVYELPCTDSVALNGTAVLRLDRLAKAHVIAVVTYVMEVSRPIALPNESVLDETAMEKRAVPLLPAGTHVVLDTLLPARRVDTLRIPLTLESVWTLSPLILRGQSDWVPVRVCAELLVLAAVPSSARDSYLTTLLRATRVSCLRFGTRSE